MFPLEIADITYTMREFLNSAYTEGVPGSANLIIQHLQVSRQASSVNELYPVLGTHSIKISQHRAVGPGSYFRATSTDGGEFYGRCIQYNPYTGDFVLKIETIVNFLPSSNWSFEFRTFTDIPSTGVNILANKLTGTVYQKGILEAFDLHNIKSPWIVFEDFGNPLSTLNGGLQSAGTGMVQTNAGEASASVYDLSTFAYLYYGNGGFFTVATAGRLVFEARVLTPAALSDGTTNYHLYIGLRGDGSPEASPFSVGGMGFYYNHSVNTGKWVCYSADNGTLGTANTTTTVVASVYTVLKIVVQAGLATFYVDEVSVGTSAIIPTAAANNLMRPLIGIKADAAFVVPKALTADYLYLEVYGD